MGINHQGLQLGHERPVAFQHNGKCRASNVNDMLIEQELARVINSSQPGRAHFKQTNFPRCAEAVFDRSSNAEGLVAVTFKRDHGVNHVLETAGTGDFTVFGHMAHHNDRRTAMFGEGHQAFSAGAQLVDRS